MALAGHNKGKKFIKGVGYRRIPKEKKPEKPCNKCGAFESEYFIYDKFGKYCCKCLPADG